jgi:aldehyde dehydrogenase (NAD+)
LVEKSIEQKFLTALKQEIAHQYQIKEALTDNYVRIIDDRHIHRLEKLIDKDKLYYGGQILYEQKIIKPTVLHQVTFEDAVMKDEIFGPVLPVIAFEDLDQIIQQVKQLPKPLACYVYGKDKKRIDKIINGLSFGGGVVNDSVMHLSNPHLPFGGVGFSGMGAYHGKAGFDTFTHYKSILKKTFWFEPPLKYPPYKAWKLKILKFLFE